MEQFVAAGGKLLGMVFLPDQAFGAGAGGCGRAHRGAVWRRPLPEPARARGADETSRVTKQAHANGGAAAFLRSYALARQLPWRLQVQLALPGRPENPDFVIEKVGDENHYFYERSIGERAAQSKRQEITAEVRARSAPRWPTP